MLARNLTDLLRVEFVQVGAATAEAHGVRTSPGASVLEDIVRMVKDKYFQGRDPGPEYPKGLSTVSSSAPSR